MFLLMASTKKKTKQVKPLECAKRPVDFGPCGGLNRASTKPLPQKVSRFQRPWLLSSLFWTLRVGSFLLSSCEFFSVLCSLGQTQAPRKCGSGVM